LALPSVRPSEPGQGGAQQADQQPASCCALADDFGNVVKLFRIHSGVSTTR
jgi:hypothetical protein